jgi:hypothetical protein
VISGRLAVCVLAGGTTRWFRPRRPHPGGARRLKSAVGRRTRHGAVGGAESAAHGAPLHRRGRARRRAAAGARSRAGDAARRQHLRLARAGAAAPARHPPALGGGLRRHAAPGLRRRGARAGGVGGPAAVVGRALRGEPLGARGAGASGALARGRPAGDDGQPARSRRDAARPDRGGDAGRRRRAARGGGRRVGRRALGLPPGRAARALELPAEARIAPYGVLALGYPAHAPAARAPKPSLEDVCFDGSWGTPLA